MSTGTNASKLRMQSAADVQRSPGGRRNGPRADRPGGRRAPWGDPRFPGGRARRAGTGAARGGRGGPAGALPDPRRSGPQVLGRVFLAGNPKTPWSAINKWGIVAFNNLASRGGLLERNGEGSLKQDRPRRGRDDRRGLPGRAGERDEGLGDRGARAHLRLRDPGPGAAPRA